MIFLFGVQYGVWCSGPSWSPFLLMVCGYVLPYIYVELNMDLNRHMWSLVL